MMLGIRKAGKQKETPSVTYDPQRHKAVLRCSICTGEQVAGFQDIRSGKFEEVMLIRSQADLLNFKRMYGVDEVAKIY